MTNKKYHMVGHIQNPIEQTSMSQNRYPSTHIHDHSLAWYSHLNEKWRRQTGFLGPITPRSVII